MNPTLTREEILKFHGSYENYLFFLTKSIQGYLDQEKSTAFTRKMVNALDAERDRVISLLAKK